MSLVVFDFDGTIADSFLYVLGFMQQEAGIKKALSKSEQLQYRGLSMKDMAHKLGIPYWRLPQLYFKGRRVMRAHVINVAPFAGMSEVIKALHKNNHQLCIVSANSAKNVRRALKHYELDEYFSAVKGGAGLFGKVTPIKKLLKRFKTPADNCWYIGDEVQDVISAKAAGVKALAVTWGFSDPEILSQFEPTATAQKPKDIISIVG